ncbi:hypothetical protein [Bdellovibrio sp. HCB2-146]|uniref:hypothetical protein n=1 Tax=Bdellovibrio sp. HCB2-146 TaxID=3394362 RepID=UPI0039BCB868
MATFFAACTVCAQSVNPEVFLSEALHVDSIVQNNGTTTLKGVAVYEVRDRILKISTKNSADSVCRLFGFDRALGKPTSTENNPNLSTIRLDSNGEIESFEFTDDRGIDQISCTKNIENPLIIQKPSFFSSYFNEKKLKDLTRVFFRWMLPLRKEFNARFDLNFTENDPAVGIAATRIYSGKIKSPYRISFKIDTQQFSKLALSIDAYYLMLCHEVGHHQNNFAQIQKNLTNSISTSERDADWYSMDYCMNYFAEPQGIAFINRVEIPPDVETFCSKHRSSATENSICKRAALAAISLTSAVMQTRDEALPSLSKEASEAATGPFGHASKQCRLDILKTKLSCLLDDQASCTKPRCMN